MKRILFFLFIYFLCSLSTEAQTNTNIPGPENVLVVYNSQIDSSGIIANYYKNVRGIPTSNIVHLDNLSDANITIDGVTNTVGLRQETDNIRDSNNNTCN